MFVAQPGARSTDFHDQFSTPRLRQKVLGEDKDIRSSFTVSDVIGELDLREFSKGLQEKCGAELLEIDASSESHMSPRSTQPASTSIILSVTKNILMLAGSFTFRESQKPIVVNLDFPELPKDSGRASKLAEHGTSPPFPLTSSHPMPN